MFGKIAYDACFSYTNRLNDRIMNKKYNLSLKLHPHCIFINFKFAPLLMYMC